MKRRPAAQLLNFMLPENLDATRGSATGQLTNEERNTAVQYTVRERVNNAEVDRQFRVLSVNIVLKDVFLQVSSLFFGVPPPFIISF